MAYDIQASAVEPMIDGMIDLLRVNLIANTVLTQDAHQNDRVLHVDNSVRFRKHDYILLMDNLSARTSVSGELSGVEFLRVSKDFQGTDVLYLDSPISKDYLVSDQARIQKTIKKAILYEKDILYGDREVINVDYVAICVEPDSKSQEWLATRLLGTDTKISIMVYVKCGGLGDEEEYAMRVCSAYADAINQLLLGNIHIDITLDETKLVRDANIGDRGVYIDCGVADDWVPGIECLDYEVQDNYGANQLMKIVETGTYMKSSSSSSESSRSTSAPTLHSSYSSSSSSLVSESSNSSSGSSASSSSSWSSQSVFEDESSSQTSVSDSSSSVSSSSSIGGICWVELNAPLTKDFLMKDKAVLRRKKRYTYDSRISDITYGMTQKGSTFMKAAKMSWFGKEAEAFQFPQPGLGRQI
jgi:hypothetical protein